MATYAHPLAETSMRTPRDLLATSTTQGLPASHPRQQQAWAAALQDSHTPARFIKGRFGVLP